MQAWGDLCGTKMENRPFGLTLCAERIAMGTAVAVDEQDFTAIAVTADSHEPIVPCGRAASSWLTPGILKHAHFY
jgi:cytidine deaminase